MIETALHQFELGVNKIEGDSGVVLVFKTTTGIIVTAYLNEEGKRNLASALSGISIAPLNLIRPTQKTR